MNRRSKLFAFWGTVAEAIILLSLDSRLYTVSGFGFLSCSVQRKQANTSAAFFGTVRLKP